MTTSIESRHFKFQPIEKLTMDNYLDWSIQTTDILIIQGISELVSASESSPPKIESLSPESGTTSTEAASWKRRDQYAMAQIRLNVSQALMVHIRYSRTAKQAWDALENVCAPKGGAVPFQRINSFFSCRPESFPSLENFVTALKERKIGCEQVDIPMSSMIYKYQLISNLPPSCAILKEILINDLKDMSEQDIEAKVLDYGRRQDVESESVLMAAKAGNGAGVMRFKCSGCGRSGHTLDGDSNGKRRCFKKYPQDLLDRQQKSSQSPSTPSSAPSGQANFAGQWTQGEEYINISAMQGVASPFTQYSWVLDCGASSHYCKDPTFFSHLSLLPHPMPIRLGNNAIVHATHSGPIHLQISSSPVSIKLRKAYFVPDLKVNLFSIGQASTEGIDSTFSAGRLTLTDASTNQPIVSVDQGINKLFSINAGPSCEECHMSAFEEWHQRMGHVNSKYLEVMSKRGDIEGMPSNLRKPPGFFCVSCVIGKSRAKPHPVNYDRAQIPLELVKGDLQGPFPVQSLGTHFSYTFNLYDQASGKRWMMGLRHKSDASRLFGCWKRLVENSSKWKLRTLLTDPGGEFVAQSLQDQCDNEGVQHLFTNVRSPEQNGGVERTNQTYVNDVLTFLDAAKLPRSLWFEAYQHAVDIRNITPSAGIDLDIPEKRFFPDKKISVAQCQPFGATGYVHIDKRKDKLCPKAKALRFVGFARDQPGFRMYNEEKRMIEVHRDVTWAPIDAGKEKAANEQQVEDTGQEGTGEGVEKEMQDVDLTAGDPSFSSCGSMLPIIQTNEAHQRPIGNIQEIAPAENGTIPTLEGEQEQQDLGEQERQSAIHDEQPIANVEGELVGRKQAAILAPQRQQLARTVKKAWIPAVAHSRIPRGKATPPSPATSTLHVKSKLQQVHFSSTNSNSCYTSDLNIADELSSTSDDDLQQTWACMVSEAGSTVVPQNHWEALKSEDHDKWREAMEKEVTSLLTNFTWTTEELPSGANLVDNRWVFALKVNAQGEVVRYKARLVAKGFSQRQGIDFTDVFAPNIRSASMRTIFAIAAQMEVNIHSLDVTTAFLHSPLKEEVYMRQPKGFEEPGSEHLVCRLTKSLYGLKQASREWNKLLSSFLVSIGFTQCISDYCVFVKRTDNAFVIIGTHTDDMAIVGHDHLIEQTKQDITARFPCTDNGIMTQHLGMEVDVKIGQISISQRRYLERIVKDAGLTDCRPVYTPLPCNIKLHKRQEGEEPYLGDYRKLTGELQHAARWTRLDIAFPTSLVAQFNDDPSMAHYQAVMHIYRYLSTTVSKGIVYRKSASFTPIIYSDSNYNEDQDDRKSTGGFVNVLAGGATAWKSTKMKDNVLSSTESEYVQMSVTATEAKACRSLMEELGFGINGPSPFKADNKPAIDLTYNPVHHERTKHIDNRFHFIRDYQAKGIINVEYCPTGDMVADIMTKPVNRGLLEKHCMASGMISVP